MALGFDVVGDEFEGLLGVDEDLLEPNKFWSHVVLVELHLPVALVLVC